MNKKQILLFSIFSALIISGFGAFNALASQASTSATDSKPSQVDEIQNRFGITLTDAQKTQIEAKQKEMETKMAEEKAKWQSMTLETYKAQEIAKINATTQAEFDKIKEMHVNAQGKGMGMRGGFNPDDTQKPAE